MDPRETREKKKKAQITGKNRELTYEEMLGDLDKEIAFIESQDTQVSKELGILES